MILNLILRSGGLERISVINYGKSPSSEFDVNDDKEVK